MDRFCLAWVSRKTNLSPLFLENVGSLVKVFSNEFGNYENRESILFGPSNKAVIFFSTCEVLPDGSRRFITTIPKGMTKQ